MSFVARRIACPPDGSALPVKLVYGADEMGQLRELAAYAEAARRTADAVVERAHRTAAELEARLAHDAALTQRRADTALLKRAVALEAAYRARGDALLARLEAVLDASLETVLRRIAVQIPAAQRIGIVADELRRHIEPGPGAQLYLSMADESACRAAGMTLPWPVKVDETLAPGTCRLSLQEAEWVLGFDAFIQGCAATR